MAEKQKIGGDAGSVNKPVPALYPSPPMVKLKTALKIVAVDLKSRTITCEGPIPAELLHAAEIERKRLDLNARLRGYAETCLKRVLPFLTPKERRAATKKELPRSLPVDAPAESHDALLTLQTLNQLTVELVKAGDWSDEIDRALCYAIDLGQLLQRGQMQIDHGDNVDAGLKNLRSRLAANDSRRTALVVAREITRIEFLRRVARGGTNQKTAILKAMSKVKKQITDAETGAKTDVHVFGNLATLFRYAKNWGAITPPK